MYLVKFSFLRFSQKAFFAQSTYRGRVETGGGDSVLSAGVYTTTLQVMVDIVKEGRCGAPPHPHQAGLIFPS